MSERCQDCGNYIPVGESCGCYAGSVPMAHTPAKNEQPMNKPASVLQKQIYAPVAEVEAACKEYLEAAIGARSLLVRGALERCLLAEQRLIEIVTRPHPRAAIEAHKEGTV